MSSTEASARGPGHCITQVALSDPGSPAPPPHTPSSPAPMLGMMKSQLLEWRRESEAEPEAQTTLRIHARHTVGFCLLSRTGTQTLWFGDRLCSRWPARAPVVMAEGQTQGRF